MQPKKKKIIDRFLNDKCLDKLVFKVIALNGTLSVQTYKPVF